jgi:hypothetical protein
MPSVGHLAQGLSSAPLDLSAAVDDDEIRNDDVGVLATLQQRLRVFVRETMSCRRLTGRMIIL